MTHVGFEFGQKIRFQVRVNIWNDQMWNGRYFGISNIKITKVELFDFSIFDFFFYICLNYCKTQNTTMIIYHQIQNFDDFTNCQILKIC